LSLFLPAMWVAAGEQAPLFAADGYRIAEFRAPVPQSVPGTSTLNTDQLRQLLQNAGDRPLLIDVLPAPGKPDALPSTSLWLPPPHENIPRSTWLPNVGYGRMSDALDAYFRNNLERLTDGERDRPIVIYCLTDCWMSWNTARRAAEYGYTQVYWYPEGTTGWEAAGLSLAASKPVPMN
jgi:PQQ-dependent catabolism-associated CXXCW motif protein